MARPGRFTALAAAVAAATLLTAARPAARVEPGSDVRGEIAAAFEAAYNLDQEAALTKVRAAIAGAPDSSAAHRALASIVWLQTLFARGAVTVDNYLGGMSRKTLNLPPPPDDLAATFHQATSQAIATAERARRANPKDIGALHDLGAAYGLQASWIATVEGGVLKAFGVARRAYDAEEQVLARDPSRVEAGAVVGTYRYAVASLGLTSRLFAYLAGFGGDKAKAIDLLERASRAGDARFEAKTALVLIYTREGRHRDAYNLLGQMTREYPRNRILVLERGASAVRAGLAGEADTILTQGLAAFETDSRRKMPGEHALWLYKRGLARLNRNHPTEAAVDFTAAMSLQPQPWVAGRLQTQLGRLADMAGRRTDAIARYRVAQDLARSSNDPVGLSEADAYLKRPFVMGHR